MADNKGLNDTSKGLSPEDWFPNKWFPLSLKDFREINEELATQSARGTAILGGAYLDWRITIALKDWLLRREVPQYKKGKPLDLASQIFGSDNKTAELSFAYKCKMAYCFGIVGEAAYRDLDRIGQIRNRLAHRMEVKAFCGDAAVERLCDELETPEITRRLMTPSDHQYPAPDPDDEIRRRDRFIRTIENLMLLIGQSGNHKPLWPDPSTFAWIHSDVKPPGYVNYW